MRKLVIIFSFISILGGGVAHPQLGIAVDIATQAATAVGVKAGVEVGKSIAKDGVSKTIDKVKELADDPLGSAIKGIGSVMLGSFQLDMLGKLLWGINYFIGFIGSILFTIAAFLVQIGLYFNTTILDTSVVQLGWRIIRDMANLGFTIGIVVIAYATILGIENYGIKKALFWFIVAAIMVNFSFSIAGVFIDASNLVTNFFVSKSITGSNSAGALPFSNANGPNVSLEGWRNSGAGELAETLADAFGPQRLLVVNNENKDAFAQLSSSAGMIVMVAATFFIAFFTILATLGMLAVGAAMLWRFIVLSGLMIIMPGAILAFGIAPPGTGNFWGKWKSEFITQLIHLPIITFFLYLTITFIKLQGRAAASGQLSVKDIAALSGPSIDKLLAIMAHPLQVMVEMILLLGLLFWGLTQSRKWSAYGGGFIIDRIQGAGDWIISAGKSKGAGAREWAARKALTAGSEPDKNLGNRLANVAAKIPFAGGIVNALKGSSSTATGKVDAYAKEYNALTDSQLLSKARNPDILLGAERMAGMAKTIAQKGKISADPTKGLTMQEFEKFIGPAKRFGLDKEVLKAAPHLFERFGWDVSRLNTFMERDFKPDDMDRVSADALKNKFVVNNLTAAHLKRLEGKDREGHRKNFITALNETMTENQARLFMKKAFERPKDIEDIHPEILKSERFVTGLNAGHMDYLHRNPPGAQEQKIILETLHKELIGEREESKNFVFEQDAEKLNNINSLAQTIIKKGETTGGWNNAQQDPETKIAYEKLKKALEPITPPSSPTPNVALERAQWNVETRKKDIEQLARGGEARPTILKSAEDALKRSEKEYQKITEQIKRQQNKPQ